MPDSILALGAKAIDLTPPRPGMSEGDRPDKVHKAAQQFEALLIAEMLKTAHGDSEGWLGTGNDQAGSSAMAIAEEQFAQALSNRGGLGLAQLIEKGLTKSTNALAR
jgi:Rod binding domain-containing protein